MTEVVTNAVRHVARDGQIDLNVALRDDALRVEVLDPGGGFVPRRRGPDSPMDGKWGLHFLELLSGRWGSQARGGAGVLFALARDTG